MKRRITKATPAAKLHAAMTAQGTWFLQEV